MRQVEGCVDSFLLILSHLLVLVSFFETCLPHRDSDPYRIERMRHERRAKERRVPCPEARAEANLRFARQRIDRRLAAPPQSEHRRVSAACREYRALGHRVDGVDDRRVRHVATDGRTGAAEEAEDAVRLW